MPERLHEQESTPAGDGKPISVCLLELKGQQALVFPEDFEWSGDEVELIRVGSGVLLERGELVPLRVFNLPF